MSNNPAKFEILIKQYLRSILDISEFQRILAQLTKHTKGRFRGYTFNLAKYN